MTRKAKHTPKTPTLRPCREVIQQIQWDPRLRLDDYTIHYEERFTGLRDSPMTEFLLKSEIPWHRIRRITSPSQIVWDRDQRIDIISELLSAPHTTDDKNETTKNDAHNDSIDTVATIEHLPVYQSALVLLPPESSWGPIQAIRKAHDPSFVRWMPHINILYGFLPEALFAQATPLIQQALQQIQPFAISLREIQMFQHKKSTTLWLQPDPTTKRAIHAIQEALLPHFPQCNEQAHKSEAGFTPHLTIAKIPQHTTATQYQRQWQEQWTPIQFDVTQVHLISRSDDQPFTIKQTIPLSTTTNSRSPRVTQASTDAVPDAPTIGTSPGTIEPSSTIAAPGRPHSHAANQIDKFVRSLWQTLIEQEQWMYLCEGQSRSSVLDHTLLWYGSHALDAALPTSDMDLLCIAPEGHHPQDVLEAIAALLPSTTTNDIPAWRIVEDAFVPALKIEHIDAAIELTCARLPLGLWGHPIGDWQDRMATLPDADRHALQGPLDAAIIHQLIQSHDQNERFAVLLPYIKRWARARCIDSQADGYPGGISWAVLAVWHCLQHPPTQSQKASDADADFKALCQHLLAWDWTTPICLPSPSKTSANHWTPHPKRDRMPILTPSQPYKNTARSITQSTLRVLHDEWQRALNLAPGQTPEGDQDALFKPANSSVHPACIQWSISAPTPATQALCEGWRKGQSIAWLLHLESLLPAHPWAFLRPYPATANQPLTISIGQAGTSWQERHTNQIKAALHQTQRWLTARWEAWNERPAEAIWEITLTLQ